MMQSAPFTVRRVVLLLGRIFLAALFIYAGASKVLALAIHPRPTIPIALSFFALQVDSYQLLSPWAVQFVAHTLPFVEILIGLLLLIGWQLRLWTTLIALLIGGFFASVLRAYALGLQINCGCFSTPEPVTLKKVVQDGILLALAVLLAVFAFQEARKPHPWSATASEPPA
jgi:uncharacterized membrane protein YphA (DoxX/SURF4 family)